MSTDGAYTKINICDQKFVKSIKAVPVWYLI